MQRCYLIALQDLVNEKCSVILLIVIFSSCLHARSSAMIRHASQALTMGAFQGKGIQSCY